MLGVEAVAEGMADHVVGHHPTMPGFGKAAQAVVATRRFEDSLHASMMTIVPSLCKMMAARRGNRKPALPAYEGSKMIWREIKIGVVSSHRASWPHSLRLQFTSTPAARRRVYCFSFLCSR